MTCTHVVTHSIQSVFPPLSPSVVLVNICRVFTMVSVWKVKISSSKRTTLAVTPKSYHNLLSSTAPRGLGIISNGEPSLSPVPAERLTTASCGNFSRSRLKLSFLSFSLGPQREKVEETHFESSE